MALSTVILAAGQGKRMHSDTPKVLQHLAGKALIRHVLAAIQPITTPDHTFIVYGHQGELLRQQLADLPVHWVHQAEQLGTGHAVQQALPLLPNAGQVLILYGDVPLISSNTLQTFIQQTPANALGIVTATLANPKGFGRVLRNDTHAICGIVEEKDATAAERAIHEINSGIYLADVNFLKRALPKLTAHNAQGEYYLTDLVQMAVAENIPIVSFQPERSEEILGVNNRSELATLERMYQRMQAERFMQQGVTLLDPNRFDLRGALTVGRDVTIDINVIIEGNVHIGNHCHIGANCILRDVTLDDHVTIKPHSMIEQSTIAHHATVGPFARLRPGSQIAPHAEIGNFIEIKNSQIGAYSKVHHVGYIGDSELGQYVNIGAGTITCNYDGANKHKTIIGDHAFIGSNTELVAPVTVGQGATIGAGSTITRDAPPEQLTLSRTPQQSISKWQRKVKKDNKAKEI